MASRFNKITPVNVKQMQPGDELREHGIVVSKLLGDERWKIEFCLHGERIHRILGRSSEGWNRSRCEARVQQIKAEILSGTSSLPAGRKTHLRLRDVAEWYLVEMEETGGKNLARKKRHVEDRLVPALGKVVADKLNEGDVSRFVKDRLAFAKPATVNRELATLNHMLRVATRRGKLTRQPCHVPRLTEELTPRTPLTNGQIASLRQAAREDHDARVWLFVEFALDTSMRQAEIGRARFTDIQWEQRRLILWKAKAGRRYQPLGKRLLGTLKAERDCLPPDQRDGWIFPAKAKSTLGHVRQFNQAFRRVVVAAGLDPEQVTPHLLRHTAITRLAERGMPISTIQMISGHKTPAMVMHYTHPVDRSVDKAMEVLEDANRPDFTEITQDTDPGLAA